MSQLTAQMLVDMHDGLVARREMVVVTMDGWSTVPAARSINELVGGLPAPGEAAYGSPDLKKSSTTNN